MGGWPKYETLWSELWKSEDRRPTKFKFNSTDWVFCARGKIAECLDWKRSTRRLYTSIERAILKSNNRLYDTLFAYVIIDRLFGNTSWFVDWRCSVWAMFVFQWMFSKHVLASTPQTYKLFVNFRECLQRPPPNRLLPSGERPFTSSIQTPESSDTCVCTIPFRCFFRASSSSIAGGSFNLSPVV